MSTIMCLDSIHLVHEHDKNFGSSKMRIKGQVVQEELLGPSR